MIFLKSLSRRDVKMKTKITIRMDFGVKEILSPRVNLWLKNSKILFITLIMGIKLLLKTKPTLVKGWEKIAMKKKNNTNTYVFVLIQIYYFFFKPFVLSKHILYFLKKRFVWFLGMWSEISISLHFFKKLTLFFV